MPPRGGLLSDVVVSTTHHFNSSTKQNGGAEVSPGRRLAVWNGVFIPNRRRKCISGLLGLTACVFSSRRALGSPGVLRPDDPGGSTGGGEEVT